MKVGSTRVRAGIWEAVLETAADAPAPSVEVLHETSPLADVSVAPLDGQPGRWAVRVPVPATVLSEGLQLLVLHEIGQDGALARLAIVAGEAPDGDLRTEVEMLRAELDLLKRAFRRHCAES